MDELTILWMHVSSGPKRSKCEHILDEKRNETFDKLIKEGEWRRASFSKMLQDQQETMEQEFGYLLHCKNMTCLGFKAEVIQEGARLSPLMARFKANQLSNGQFFCKSLVRINKGPLMKIQFLAEEACDSPECHREGCLHCICFWRKNAGGSIFRL
jgi:hypothetical protein